MAGRIKAGLPFAGVGDGLDLVRKVWGVAGLPTPTSMAQFAQKLPQALPSMIAPTLDVDELDKRIADLRAVEQWLNLNLSMLRATVQSLEVQRNTIATLKSFSGAMLAGGAPAQPPTGQWPYATPTAAAPAAAPVGRKRRAVKAAAAALPLNPVAWWNTLQDQFGKIAATAAAEAQAAAKAAAEAQAAETGKTQAGPAKHARKRRTREAAGG